MTHKEYKILKNFQDVLQYQTRPAPITLEHLDLPNTGHSLSLLREMVVKKLLKKIRKSAYEITALGYEAISEREGETKIERESKLLRKLRDFNVPASRIDIGLNHTKILKSLIVRGLIKQMDVDKYEITELGKIVLLERQMWEEMRTGK